MNAASEKPTERVADWTEHYEKLGHHHPRRASRIRHRRGLSPMRLALLLLGIAVLIVSAALASL